MPAAYAVVIREKTRNPAKLDEYKQIVPAIFQTHHATFLANHGRFEVLDGPKSENIIIIEFPSYEAARAWYHSTEYQAACERRFQGGDYRCASAFPRNRGGSAPALVFSRPAQRSLTLRPARSPSRLATLFTEGFSCFVASAAASIATGWSEPVPGRV